MSFLKKILFIIPKRQLAATIGLAKIAVLQPTVSFLTFNLKKKLMQKVFLEVVNSIFHKIGKLYVNTNATGRPLPRFWPKF